MATTHSSRRPTLELVHLFLVLLLVLSAQLIAGSASPALAGEPCTQDGKGSESTLNRLALQFDDGSLLDTDVDPWCDEGGQDMQFLAYPGISIHFSCSEVLTDTQPFSSVGKTIVDYWVNTSVGVGNIPGSCQPLDTFPTLTTLTIDKTQVDNRGEEASPETFIFEVICDGITLTDDATVTGSDKVEVTGVLAGATCGVTETETAGASSTEAGTDDAALVESDAVTGIEVGAEGVTVYFRNTFDPDLVIPGTPDISLTKTAVAVDAEELILGELVQLGDDKILAFNEDTDGPFEITYTFLIENTGDVTLFDVVLEDPMLGGELTIDQDLSAGFAPGDEPATATATFLLDPDEVVGGTLDNTATVTAVDENQTPVDATATESIQVVAVGGVALTADIAITKHAVDGVTPDEDGKLVVAIEGEDGTATVTYQMTVTNTGDDDLSDLALVDDQIGDLTGTLLAAVSATFGGTVLPAGGSVTITADHTVGAGDFDGITLTNVVEVVGTGVLSDATVSADDDETVTLSQVLDETLPATGSDRAPLTGLGLALLLLGAALLYWQRPRRLIGVWISAS